MALFKKISRAAYNRKTYRVGLLQTKAYRILKQRTSELLKPHGISSVQWALLGLLYDFPKGLRSNILALELGVEAPFVTQMVAELSKHNFIKTIGDPSDSRAKLICLNDAGKEFVSKTESYLYKEMRPLLKDVRAADVLSYIFVLESIIKNSD